MLLLSSYFCGARPGDLAGHHDATLVALSVAISIIGSYTAVDLTGRTRSAQGSGRRLWLILSAIVMGGSIWSMHFVAMLAFSLPVPITYDVTLTLLSLLAAILVTGAGLSIVGRQAGGLRNLAMAGTFMGLGIGTMHYTGMAAMRMNATLSYDWALYAASIGIAIVASAVALWLAFRLERRWPKAAASLVMGAAIAGMHYTGMEAAHYTPEPGLQQATGVSSVPLLAMVIAVATFGVLLIGLVSSYADRRLTLQMDREAAALRNNERRFRNILDTAFDAFVTIDAEGRIQFWNAQAEAIFGWSHDEAIGLPLTDTIIPERFREAHLKGLNRYLATRRDSVFSQRRELTAVHRDGHEFPIELTISPTWVDGEVTINAFIQDISERQNAKDELIAARDQAEAANRAKSVFLAKMSHELRTPLNAVIGFSELIRDSKVDQHPPETFREYAQDINLSGRHLLDLINEILDLSKAEAGRLELREEACDIAEAIAVSMSTIRAAAEAGRVTVTVAAGRGLPRLLADRRRLRQILINLLSNAVRFTPGGGSVELTVNLAPSGGLVFAIVDTGIGMTASQIEIALTPFGQIDNQLARRFDGSGLGLPLAKQLLELHQGRLDIVSSPGIGTTAKAYFPSHRLQPMKLTARASE